MTLVSISSSPSLDPMKQRRVIDQSDGSAESTEQ
jgi:hypothetical protein